MAKKHNNLKPCSRLWTDINLNLFRKQIRNCCKSRPLEKQDIEEVKQDPINYWTNRKELREQKQHWVSENFFPETCKQCANDHPNSLYNTWNKWIDKPNNFFANLVNKDFTNHIEIALSTVCNQTCLYCNAETSSMWAKVLGQEVNEIDQEWHNIALNGLYQYIEEKVVPKNEYQRYDFLGGETFLVPEFFDVVKRICKLHQNSTARIEMNFISNLNIKPALLDKFIELTNEFKNINWILSASIENVGVRAETMRQGLDFSLFENNLNKVLDAQSITKIQVLPSLNALSIYDHTDFLEWIWNKCIKYRGIKGFLNTWTLTTNIVNYPVWLSPKILPSEAKDELDKVIKLIDSKKQFVTPHQQAGIDIYIKHMQGIKNLINTDRTNENLQMGRENFDRFAKLFSTDYQKIFPEFNKIYLTTT